MTEPDDLVEVEVAPEQVRPGDLLVPAGDDEVTGSPEDDERAPEHLAIPVRTAGRALVPRGVLTRVRRPRSQTTLAETADPIAVQLAEVRELALALADQAGGPQGKSLDAALDRTARAAKRVRARLEETSTDGTDRPAAAAEPGPGPAPVLGVPQPAGQPPAAASAVEPGVQQGAPETTRPAAAADPRGPRRDR